MDQIRTKIAISAAIAAVVVIAVPLVGTTEAESDDVRGMMIDFGYWSVDWIPMTFHEGTDGYAALDAACGIRGYDAILRDDGSIYSIGGQSELENARWAFYVPAPGGGWAAADPASTDVSDHRIVCFARASGAEDVMPGTDGTGLGYQGYADGGVSRRTGEDLRIATLAPSVTETLCAVGGERYIVGTDLYSDHPQGIVDGQKDGSIAITGGYTDPNYEYIVRLGPDIVFCDGGAGEHLSMADKLRKSGIDCVVLMNCTGVDALYRNMWIAASAIGMPENADSAINGIRSTIDGVSGIAGMTNQRVFAALSADPSPWTTGSVTYMSDILALCGSRNVFDTQSSGWFMVSKEQIYKKQPQVIIVMQEREVATEREYRDVLDSLDPLWRQTPAYADGRVFVFSGAAADILQRPGPRLAEAAELLCKCLNPEAFSKIDPLDTIPSFFGDDYAQYLTHQKGAAA